MSSDSNSTQVEKFDPSKLMDGVKDRIKATFVSLIPDTEWEKLVEREIKSFFEEPVSITVITQKGETGYYSDPLRYTTNVEMPMFRYLVWARCIDEVKKLLEQKVTSEYLAATWSHDEPLKMKMKEIITKSAPELYESFFGQIITGATPMVRSIVQEEINRTIVR